MILLIGLCSAGHAEDVVPSDDEKALMGLINEARHDPLGMAKTLGMDPDQVLADLPELADILKTACRRSDLTACFMMPHPAITST